MGRGSISVKEDDDDALLPLLVVFVVVKLVEQEGTPRWKKMPMSTASAKLTLLTSPNHSFGAELATGVSRPRCNGRTRIGQIAPAPKVV